MAIVSCPECSKKLKVADTSIGKKVKCSCGNVFVAESGNGAPAKAAPAAAPDKVMVACTECGAKLKVGTASLGKKMKCPKCAGVFVAAAEDDAPAPVKKAPPPEDDDAPAPAKKGKAASDDDMDDLFSFAQKDADADTEALDQSDDDFKPKGKGKKPAFDDSVEEDFPKPKGKKKFGADEDDEDAPKPKSKFGAKKPGKPSPVDDEEGKKPVYPSRTLLNLFVLLCLMFFIAIFAVMFLDFLPDVGLPKVKPRQAKKKEETEDEKKKRLEAAAAENKKEAEKFNGTWIVESMEEQSKPVLDKGGKPVKGDVYTFKDGKVNSPLLKDADFSVDTSADPKLLNISSSPKEKWIGVYQLEGDTMTWCLISTGEIKDGALSVEQEGRRPRALDSKAGMLYVLKKKGAGGGDDTNKTEAAKLNGVWLIQSYEFNGNTNPEIVGGKYTFADDILTAVHPDFHKTPYSVVAGKDPMWIDITQRKMKYQGIYKLDGDTLQLCINEGKRPAKFDSKEGELFTLKREGKGKPPDEVKPKGGSGKLDGAWMIESAMKNGKSDDMAKGEAMEFENGKLTGSGPPVSFVLKEPNVIDLLISGGPGKTITLAGIYKLEGGKLHLCFPAGKDPSARPADFDAKDTSVAVLRRATKDDVRYSRAQSVTNLKLIGIAIHGHVDATKFLPPAASSGTTDGKPLLSWRVALLPYMKELDLYKQFDLNKAWDDPHNMKLVAKMPKVYAVSGIPAKEGMTHYRTIVGPGALLDPIKDGTGKLTTKYKLFSAPDGISNVIMVAEAKEAVIWTKPDELAYDPKGPLPKFGVVPAGFNVLVGDGAVFWVPATTPDRVLHPYMTCNNGMPREPLGGSKSDDGIKSKDFPPEKSKEPEELPRKEKPAVDKEAVNPRLEDAKREVAKAQLQVLTKAALAYAIRNNNKYPQSLAELLQKDETGAGPYLQDKRALVDPWNLLYQYDPTGPRNDGKRPDIWTVAPGKQVIGNWPVAQGK